MDAPTKKNQSFIHNEHAPIAAEESIILGSNVERMRLDRNMNITEFAYQLGVSRPTIYKIERGESDLKLSFIKKIALALNTSVIDLLTPHKG